MAAYFGSIKKTFKNIQLVFQMFCGLKSNGAADLIDL